MRTTLSTHIEKLPHRKALDPLRERWPGLFGGIFQVDEHRWATFIVSSDPDVSFKEIAEEVDSLFAKYGLSKFIKNKNVSPIAYTFWLVEPLSPKEGSNSFVL